MTPGAPTRVPRGTGLLHKKRTREAFARPVSAFFTGIRLRLTLCGALAASVFPISFSCRKSVIGECRHRIGNKLHAPLPFRGRQDRMIHPHARTIRLGYDRLLIDIGAFFSLSCVSYEICSFQILFLLISADSAFDLLIHCGFIRLPFKCAKGVSSDAILLSDPHSRKFFRSDPLPDSGNLHAHVITSCLQYMRPAACLFPAPWRISSVAFRTFLAFAVVVSTPVENRENSARATL